MVRKITKWEIMGCYLNDYSRRHYLRELADLLKKPHQSIKPYVEELTKESILIRYDRKNLVEYGLNLKDRRTYDYLIISEKERLIKRLEEDTYLRTLFEKLSPYFRDNTFIIFGSASERLQKGSDIDLLVIGKQNITKTVAEFENVYNKRIHKIQVNSLDRLTIGLIKEVYKKHLIFNNTEQVILFFGGLYEENKLV